MSHAFFRNENLIRRLFWLTLTVFFILNLAHKWVIAGSYAPDLGGFERNVIWGIQQIMNGLPLYTNSDAAPFSMIQYMPLYYHLMAGLAKITGISSQDAHGVYTICRTFNLLISLLICGSMTFVLRQNFRLAALPALGFSVFAFLLLEPFSVSGRPDTLKTFFFVAQVLLLSSAANNRIRFLIPVSLLFSLLCFLCKQDGLLAFAILPLAFIAGREWKMVFLYSLLAGVLLVLSLIIFQKAFDGNFLSNVFGALQNGISISWFMTVFRDFFVRYSLIFATALILSIEFSEEKNRSFRILAAGFLLSFFPPLLASLKFGSGPNYFQEALLLSCFLIAIASKSIPVKGIFRYSEHTRLFMMVLFMLFFGMASLQWATGIFLHQENRLKQEYESDLQFSQSLRSRFPQKQILLLTDRQWEDNLSTLLADRIVNPNRDVSAQVYSGKNGDALQSLRNFIEQSDNLLLITRKGQKPAFDGLIFPAYRPGEIAGNYQLWLK